MDRTAPPPPPATFQAVPERNTGDVILRTAQQHHVQLSAMADVKASIIITASSIVLTVTLGRAGDAALQAGAMILVGFTLLALLLAVLSVLPKYHPVPVGDGPLPRDFNLLFFGHFASLSRERFVAEVSRVMQTGGTVYETMAKDLYSLGYYLAHYKYRYLRLSYVCFLSGFVLASLQQVVHWVLH